MGRREQPVGRRGSQSALAKANALWRARRFDEALRQFQEAVRQTPNDISVLLGASRAFGARFRMDRCQALLDKALRLGGRRADVQHAAGKTYQMLGQMAPAETCYRRANQLASTPQSQLELAKICERRHALDEAAELVASALRSEPRWGPALLLRARLERRRGATEQALSTLRSLTTNSHQDPKLSAQAYGELCTLHDAAGDFDAAWNAILACKQLQLPQEAAAWNASQFVLARCRRMVEKLTGAHFSRWRSGVADAPPARLALLTGFPRSGTTLLEQVLEAHPDVVSSEEKEVFSAEVLPQLGEGRPPDSPLDELLDELSEPQLLAARQLYLSAMESLLGEPVGGRLHVDKNPAMNLMIPAMRRVFPELKLVVALRDPRDVIVSCFLRHLPINPVSVCFLTLERTVDRYQLDMNAWLKMRELLDGWIEVRYEDTVADLPHVARRTVTALDLPWQDAVLQYRTHVGKRPVQSPSYEEVARPIFTSSVGRWQNYAHHLGPALEQLAPLVTALGYKL